MKKEHLRVLGRGERGSEALGFGLASILVGAPSLREVLRESTESLCLRGLFVALFDSLLGNCIPRFVVGID